MSKRHEAKPPKPPTPEEKAANKIRNALILSKWKDGETAEQISAEMNLPIGIINGVTNRSGGARIRNKIRRLHPGAMNCGFFDLNKLRALRRENKQG